jgi:hypothetical protein
MEQIQLAVDEARLLESPVLELRALVDGARWNDEPQLRARLMELIELLDGDEGADVADARTLLASTGLDTA